MIKLLTFLVLFPSIIFAQNFDEAFLESLPYEIRSDLINRTLDKDNLQKPQYKRPSSYILKPASRFECII